jgi:hypothetical protein
MNEAGVLTSRDEVTQRNRKPETERMSEAALSQLQQAVERTHSAKAAYSKSVQVTRAYGGQTLWTGRVAIFELVGHPRAALAYAWSSPIAGTESHRFYTILHGGDIGGAAEAVQAAIALEHRIAK